MEIVDIKNLKSNQIFYIYVMAAENANGKMSL